MMPVFSNKFLAFTLLLAGMAFASPCHAWHFLEEGHTDLNWNYSGGEWSAELLDDDVFPALPRPPETTLLVVKDLPYYEGLGSRITRLEEEMWDFIGVGPGEEFWVLPRTNSGEPILDLGLAAYDISSSDIVSMIDVALTGYEFIGQGEGMFSVFIYNAFLDNLSVEIATNPDFAAPDVMQVAAGGHRHMNWAFSVKGIHRVTFTASGLTVAGNESSRVFSDPVTFTFGVGLSPFELWLLENNVGFDAFGPADSPAGDGVGNLLKYALGLPPLVPVTGPLVEPSFFEDEGAEYLALDVTLNPTAEGIGVRVEVGDDLADWHSGDGHTVVIEHTAERIHVRDETAGAARRFMRLAVEQVPADE